MRLCCKRNCAPLDLSKTKRIVVDDSAQLLFKKFGLDINEIIQAKSKDISSLQLDNKQVLIKMTRPIADDTVTISTTANGYLGQAKLQVSKETDIDAVFSAIKTAIGSIQNSTCYLFQKGINKYGKRLSS